MGQIPDKTYIATDGSVYRVEADGSITKNKGGRVQPNESPSKYNITPDGKIYRVESDGSVTYSGNAEDRQSPSHYAPTTNTKKSSWKWLGVIILVIIVAAAIGIYVTNQNYSTYNDNYYSNNEQYSSNAELSYESPAQSTEYIEQQNNTSSNEVLSEGMMLSDEDEVLYNEFYPGDIQGEFYGVVEGLGTIRGIWTCGSQMGSGWYCIDGQNESSGRDLDFINEEPLVWHESIDHGDYYESTGTWYFDYFNGTKDRIATGTYVRGSDNQRFPFTLFKK